MQIVDKSYFSKENQINIPLAISIPTAGVVSPSNENYIDLLCVRVEKDLLINALGVDLYNEFKSLTTVTIEEPTNIRWKNLLNGQEYDGKIWHGLKHEMNLIALKVYETYVTETNSSLTQSGNVQTNSEHANLFTPAYKIANADQMFIAEWQGTHSNDPIIQGNFIDWFGTQDATNVSLYRYLIDKKTDFPTWEVSKFKFYCQTKNTFGL